MYDLSRYRDSDAFTEVEKVVLDLAVAMTRTPADVPEELFRRLQEHFSAPEIVELTTAVALENFRARFNRPFAVEAMGLSEGSLLSASRAMTCQLDPNPVRRRNKLGRDIKLEIKVIPASSRNAVTGWLGDALKVRVTAAAERGKANAAVEATIAEAVGVPRASVRVVAGRTSHRKVIEIVGLSEAEVYNRLPTGSKR